jgi:hypothetical protein
MNERPVEQGTLRAGGNAKLASFEDDYSDGQAKVILPFDFIQESGLCPRERVT